MPAITAPMECFTNSLHIGSSEETIMFSVSSQRKRGGLEKSVTSEPVFAESFLLVLILQFPKV